MKEPMTGFFRAVSSGDAAGVRRDLAANPELVRAHADPELVLHRRPQWTALHLAAYAGQAEIERALVEAGADVDALNDEGRTALHVALEHNNTTRKTLLELGARVDVSAAAFLGRIDRLRELLDAEPEQANDRSTGLSPLGWASFAGKVEAEAAAMRYTGDSTEFVKLLLEAGADVNLRTASGKTALEIAIDGDRRQKADPEAPGTRDRAYAAVAQLLRAPGAS